MAKRGKVKATELKNVRVDFVSLVRQGANAERFQIYKSAEAIQKEETEKRKAVEIDKKDIGVFERILNLLKGKSNEEEIEMGKAEEILKAVEDLSGKVTSLTERVDKIEKGEEDDPNPDGNGGDESEKEKKEKQDKAAAAAAAKKEGDTTAGDGSGGGGDDKPTGKKAEKKPEDEKEDKVLAAIKGISEKMDSLGGRVEKIEKTRGGSNQIQKDKKNKDQEEEVSFANIFPTGNAVPDDSGDDE